MRRTITMSLFVLALAACSRPAQNAADATPATPAAGVSAANSTLADGDDSPGETMPAPRAGLWSITTTSTPARQGRLNGAVQNCSDGTSPVRMGGGMRRRGACAPTITHGDNGAITFASDCTTGSGSHLVSHGALSGDMQTAYRVHVEADVSGAPVAQMNGHRVTDINARYVGACPGNMGPGDISIGGRVITREMMRQMGRGMGGGAGGGMGGGGGGGGGE